MIKVFRWLMLLFSIYVVVVVAKFYAVNPRELLNLDRAGAFRFGGSIITLVAVVMLSLAIVRDSRKQTPDVRQRDTPTGPLLNHSRHLFKIVFRRHPILTSSLGAVLFLLPLLLELALNGGRFSLIDWSYVLVGEAVSLVIFVVAWFTV